MSYTVIAATSPFNCVWIDPGSRRSIDGFDYAVCRRMKDAERVVNEAECRYCPAWRPSEPAPHRPPDPAIPM